MTEIVANKFGKLYRISIDHHAATDEVCHAISTLIYTLEGALFNNDKATEHVSTLEPGHAEVSAYGGETVYEDFKVILLGLMQIQMAYPEQINIVQNFF